MTPGAVILCGGESRRMGQPKAWLRFGDERMLQRIVRLVGLVARPVAVVAAPGQDLPPLPSSVTVVRDAVQGRGPLQGLAAGLRALPEGVELAYASGTDVPFFEPGWVRRLEGLIGDADLAIPVCDGRHHPLAALYRRATALPAIDALLAADRLRPVFLMERLRTREVTAEELEPADPGLRTLRNLNTPADYEAALLEAEQGEPAELQGEPRSAGQPLPRVHVELFGVPRLRAGVSRVWVQAADLASALRGLGVACPALIGTVVSGAGKLDPAYTVNLNGEEFVGDPGTPLKDGDSLIVLAIDVGG
jgi:molybdopterin-guanine dinucleotide biosynthesis protein A